MSESDAVRAYFDRIHDDFDRIYRDDKGHARRLADRVFRASIEARLEWVLALHRKQGFQRVLDVGCGSGRYGIALARLGAKDVLGLDFAPAMVRDAERLAAEAGVGGACRFRVADFMRDEVGRGFDLSLAIGVFDYTADPVPMLRRMGERSGTVVGSFPVRWHPFTPLRKVRLASKGVPVRFYTAGEVRRAMEAAGLEVVELVRLHRDLVAAGRPRHPGR